MSECVHGQVGEWVGRVSECVRRQIGECVSVCAGRSVSG